MIASDWEIKNIRAKDKEKLREITSKLEDARTREIDRHDKRIQEVAQKAKSLHEEKEALLRSPMSKSEFLEYAKASLRSLKKEAEEFLVEHFRDCQKGHDLPLNYLALRLKYSEDKAWRIVHLFLTEELIDKLVSGLEEIGMPKEERDARISAIDKELEQIRKSIE